MAKTVAQAFNEFLRNEVNLDSSKVTIARSSRNWLKNEIAKLPDKDSKFPVLCSEYNLDFGSFARKTKTNPLDDIDIMIGMSADGCTYTSINGDPENVILSIPESYTGPLSNYKHTVDGKTNTLSSWRVVNKFKTDLTLVHSYRKAEIKRNGEAATLKLESYPWNFDIVPCFHTLDQPGALFSNRYIIPNAKGDWRITDPRVDRERLIEINRKCNGHMLGMIRLIKQWNQYKYRVCCPSSYLLETMISNYYNALGAFEVLLIDSNMRVEIAKVFTYLSNNIYNWVEDPKGISGNINQMDLDVKSAIRSRLNLDISRINDANYYESIDFHEQSIKLWCDIFGVNFPSYNGN